MEKNEPWQFKLVAGDCVWENGTHTLITQLENDLYYDAELLPNLFTFREIFWQPNVYPTLNACLTGLKLVVNYGQELTEDYATAGEETRLLYAHLVSHIGKLAQEAHEVLSKSDQASEQIPAVLGEFRKQSFPVIMLFIHHPMNRIDYREDALRRVNFMVKTLLDQYQLRFNDLMLPYWEISRASGTTAAAGELSQKTQDEKPAPGAPETETTSPT